jgi:hypothetical protein
MSRKKPEGMTNEEFLASIMSELDRYFSPPMAKEGEKAIFPPPNLTCH